MVPISRPLIGEEEKNAVMDVLNSGMLAQGKRTAELEEAFAEICGVQHAVATSSGTTALHVALLAHGIGAGDEVITSSFSFIATANSILYTGAQPVFVDIDPETFNLDPSRIEEAITPRTKAIMPVHIFGQPCDMDAIMEIADRRGLLVIEDACQAHGAEYKGARVGSFGAGTFSLYPTKNITSGEGGIITTDDPDVAENCRVIRQHGMRQRYYHTELGFNFRMTDLHAAIGIEQCKKLEAFNAARIANARFYDATLEGVCHAQERRRRPPCLPSIYDSRRPGRARQYDRPPDRKGHRLRRILPGTHSPADLLYPGSRFRCFPAQHRGCQPGGDLAAGSSLVERAGASPSGGSREQFRRHSVIKAGVIKAAVIGVGSMGRNHARVYRELAETTLVGVADMSEQNAERVAAEYQTHSYQDYRQLLEEDTTGHRFYRCAN